MSLERCRVQHVQIAPQHLIVSGLGRFRRAQLPDFAVEAYRKLAPTVNLRCLPHLVPLEHAAGAGGFYAGGVIAFGLADLEDLADRMANYFATVDPQEEWRLRAFEPHRLITAQDRLTAAMTALLAHELGHAVGAQWQVSKFGVPEEVQADELAGQMAGALCTRSELDRAFFHAIGCTSPRGCTHPHPEARVQAYDRGRTISDRCVDGQYG
jgi:hypothetical protein